MLMDQVIDRLATVLAENGLRPLSDPRPDTPGVLDEITAAISPLRLPDDVLRFWQRVDPGSLQPLCPFPRLTSPDFALHCRREFEKEQRTIPTLLFPLAYQSHCYTFVELSDGHHPGGAIFNGPDDFELTHPDLTSYLDQLTTMIELGEFSRERLSDGDDWCEFDPENRWEEIARIRLTGTLPLPVHGRRRTIPGPIRDWPRHWRLPSGLTDQDRQDRQDRQAVGADSTIATLMATAARGVRSHGVIHAQIGLSAGTSEGRRLSVHDGTGTLDLWCPAAVSAYLDSAPVLEFEVVVRPHPSGPPDIDGLGGLAQQLAMSGDIEGAQRAGSELAAKLFESPADAVAVAIRPVN
ncbi:hypothetical protein [Kineosporia sp. NBRC 101731]|uniref:hypothetical protein n=1 Tax=Kineosporia sp. NBRC 101731 TaxID=3032199 RepID=UPI0024A5C9F4|nr:hypothetical protein [Kineosporia sp. NBRC 101731]GLY29130.1 hypothetical protein Kisp02_24950 [Kineosporia sp. NBRC 101731]